MSEFKEILMSEIDEPNEAHRLSFNEAALYELADSIRDMGLQQPIIVAAQDDGHYQIIAGHRRFIAHQILKRRRIVGGPAEYLVPPYNLT